MGLTVKQRTFSKLVAQGLPQIEAYERVYKTKSKAPTRNSRKVQSTQLATQPAVKAEIAKYEAQLVPIGDLRRLKEEMLSNLRWLATECPDMRVRLLATRDLKEYCEERERREEARKPVTIDALITEIADMQPQPAIEMESEPLEAETPAE